MAIVWICVNYDKKRKLEFCAEPKIEEKLNGNEKKQMIRFFKDMIKRLQKQT